MLQVPAPCIAYGKNPSAARTSPSANPQALWTEEFRAAARWSWRKSKRRTLKVRSSPGISSSLRNRNKLPFLAPWLALCPIPTKDLGAELFN